jgi:hypothetical protein
MKYSFNQYNASITFDRRTVKIFDDISLKDQRS